VGSTFAFQLSRAGHAVTVIARPGSARLQQLQRDSAIVQAKGERAQVTVADTLDEQTAFDLVLVTTLPHQLSAVLPALQRSRAKAIQFMHNTFEPETQRDAVGAARCSFGMPFVMATVDSEGRLHATINSSQRTLMSEQRWVDLFNAAGIPSSLEKQMLLWLRCHVPLGVAMESAAAHGQRRRGGATWAEATTIARGAQQAWALTTRLGYKLYPSSVSWFYSSPAFVLASLLWAFTRVTSFRGLLATGEAECVALADVMIAKAAALDPPAPTAAIEAMKPAASQQAASTAKGKLLSN
jgi:2-dehydropantoate 2-reductase